MPGRPQDKIKRITDLVEWFSEFAVDFDKLLPSIYRFDGKPPGRDRRANAWAKCDQHTVILADALAGLQDVLRKHAARASTAYIKVESELNGDELARETTCPADSSLSPSRRTKE